MALYNLIQDLYVLLDDGDRRVLNAVGLSPSQYNLLSHLPSTIKNGPTISQLADKLLCTRGNITRLVKRMEKHGLVRSGSDIDDQRLVRVALTSEGEARFAEAQVLHAASLRRRLGIFDDFDLESLTLLNQRLAEHLKEELSEQEN